MLKKGKKPIIDGVVFYPRKKHPPCSCLRCKQEIVGRAYTKGSQTSDLFYCSDCVTKMLKRFKRMQKDNAEPFNIDNILYVGTKEHKYNCPDRSKEYEEKLMRFSVTGRYVYLHVFRCKYCGQHMISRKVYDTNAKLLEEYKTVRTKDGIPLNYHEFDVKDRVKQTPKLEKKEIPEKVRWAATHPYQGGGCSPK